MVMFGGAAWERAVTPQEVRLFLSGNKIKIYSVLAQPNMSATENEYLRADLLNIPHIGSVILLFRGPSKAG